MNITTITRAESHDVIRAVEDVEEVAHWWNVDEAIGSERNFTRTFTTFRVVAKDLRFETVTQNKSQREKKKNLHCQCSRLDWHRLSSYRIRVSNYTSSIKAESKFSNMNNVIAMH